ncbi:putative transcription factor CP2-like 1 [Scophthalmus maximus]|uniref:Putative transcription factor CP2-like 1 n=1 Tax=Scophthalmus maximus TaxID=52904 RepID=A0A2U9CAD9_SCOMX|nr:transcription factor CP2-like protein 1 isoform X2 [Scophthalmus maximus]AWP12736.1 putative transcription factor CP2-like 1 [Scophthalmus maximus]
MLFCHSQPESYHQPSASYIREAIAPFLTNEEARLMAESALGAKRSPFQYVLCAATSPAVKQQEETLTYLNQGQSYEIRLLNRKLVEYTDISSKYVKSIVRVVFHDRRLQYMEHQQLEGWRWNRPGDRILDIDVPLSVGILEPRSHALQLNTVEFLWDPAKNASAFIQVNCISTEFTPRKHGGEKGVPFRIQVDTFTTNQQGEYMEHVHSSSCQIRVFKPKGADRKLKTDREKMDKKTLQDREKYHLCHETTPLKECSPWPDALHLTTHSSCSTPSPVYHSSPTSCSFTDGDCSPHQQGELLVPGPSDHLLPSCSPQGTQEWLHRHRFSSFSRVFTSFSGADLLRMSRDDLIQICGPADGIRLFNTMKGRCIQPRLTIYVCLQQAGSPPPTKPGGGDIYLALYLEELTLLDLSEKISLLYSIAPRQITHIYRRKPNGIHVLVSDEMVQNFGEETSFIISTIRDENTDGFHVVLK